MARATWQGTVLAESDTFETVEGNIYFPREALKSEFFKESDTQTKCFWKGVAHYYHVVVNGEVNEDAAWYYPETKKAAANIRDHIAFWRGVEVEE